MDEKMEREAQTRFEAFADKHKLNGFARTYAWWAFEEGMELASKDEEVLRLHREMAALRQMLNVERNRASNAIAISNHLQDERAIHAQVLSTVSALMQSSQS